MTTMRAIVLLLGMVLLGGCGSPRERITGCAALGELAPVCGFSRPEDMELLGDSRTLLISEMGSPQTNSPGSLVLFDTRSETITRLPQFTEPSDEYWGQPSCTTPPGTAFSPHGIHLSRRADGRWQVLAVNHGGRESVEYFELSDDSAGHHLEWRGCVLPPPDSYLNDVVALPEGGFLATHMFPKSGPTLRSINLHMLKGMLGFATGHVVHCDNGGCNAVAGTETAFPNGIQLARDGRTMYVDGYLAGEVRKISYPDGRLLGIAKVDAPDNIQWDADGRLLVASHIGGYSESRGCYLVTEGACPAAFAIVEIDPQSMQSRTVFRHAGAPMGAATVAQQAGDALYLGSYAGDRILRVPLTAISARPRTP
ncbi:MAG: SMP-30/gluconolactonase/LRE family protein [Pseudomonadales bacterium]|jgi:hypothetical protein|nr:SMP-30/gluconolactonase/LRE family protein [Gammaproteobacteria bacterium]MBP6050967.1 SMP-30/gluconolactonase/LRE family protein [Pseudomonadales bacterium]MBK6582474.1 SMP-30/gluconolactonase/LRE family protein [Gammaproteobacteria bacterium]MBK7521259.1 SMP-30/gluconolactonase/LRE family protein [Gammaproteobacteria bacterium]MBK8306944.1 SMP-30/gluconolactonase/LRE family protein [Gammaproteobacteria bacterium]